MLNRFDRTWLFLPILMLPCLLYAIFILSDPIVPIHQSSNWLLAWYHGALIPDLMWEKAQYHRLLLAGLIHFDPRHLFSNMSFILLISAYALMQLRLKVIHLWFLLYGSSILGYFLLSFRSSAWSHGISGGVYALLAFTVLSSPLRYRKASIVILCLLAFVDQGGFDLLNHVLGLALGTIYFYLVLGNQSSSKANVDTVAQDMAEQLSTESTTKNMVELIGVDAVAQKPAELEHIRLESRRRKIEIIILCLSIVLGILQCYTVISWKATQTSLFSQSFFHWSDEEKECEKIDLNSKALSLPHPTLFKSIQSPKFIEKYSNSLFYLCQFDPSSPMMIPKNESLLAQTKLIKSENFNQIQRLILSDPSYQGLFTFLVSCQSHQYLLISRIDLNQLLLKSLSQFSLNHHTLTPWEEGILLKLNALEKNDCLNLK